MRVETIIDVEKGTVAMILPKGATKQERILFMDLIKGHKGRQAYKNKRGNIVLKLS